jgi:hypothetical protein
MNIVADVGLILILSDIGSPPRHKFNIFEAPFFSLQFEVRVDSDIEKIKISGRQVQ